MLESRLRELEGSPAVSRSSIPPLQRFHSTSTEHTQRFYNGSMSERLYGSTSSFELTTFSTNGSPTPGSPTDSSWVGDQYDLQLGGQRSSRVVTSEDLPWVLDPRSVTPDDLLKVSGRWWDADVLPPRIQQFLCVPFLSR